MVTCSYTPQKAPVILITCSLLGSLSSILGSLAAVLSFSEFWLNWSARHDSHGSCANRAMMSPVSTGYPVVSLHGHSRVAFEKISLLNLVTKFVFSESQNGVIVWRQVQTARFRVASDKKWSTVAISAVVAPKWWSCVAKVTDPTVLQPNTACDKCGTESSVWYDRLPMWTRQRPTSTNQSAKMQHKLTHLSRRPHRRQHISVC